MSTRKIASVAFTGAAAVATVGFGTQAANAAPASAWHVTPGNSTNFTGTNKNNPVLVDNVTGATLTCTKATAKGHVIGDGKSAQSASLATISSATFGSTGAPCSLAGIPFTAKLKKATTLWGAQYAAGVTTGHIGNGATSDISASINGIGSVSCHAEIRGATLPGKFVNANDSLNINSGHAATLHVKSVQGCLGLINASDSAYFSAIYTVNPAITVTRS